MHVVYRGWCRLPKFLPDASHFACVCLCRVFGCQLVLKEEEAVRDKLERDRLAAQKASAAAAKQAADRMESKARREMKKAKADADEAIADALAEAQKLVEVQQAMKAEADESRQALEQISSLTSLSPALALCEEHGVTPLLPQLSGALSQLDQVFRPTTRTEAHPL